MIKNYFRIAWRSLAKDRQFTLLNLMGLSSGLACVLLIYLWVNDELHVDKFNANDDRIYQVMKKNSDGTGAVQVGKNTQGMLAGSMAESFPEIERAVSFKGDSHNSIISYGDKHLKVVHAFAGKDFFHVFSFPLTANSSDTVSGVSGMFLSEAFAIKLFNTSDVVGKTIDWNYKDDINFSGLYKIAGVFKTPAFDNSLRFDVLFPFELYAQKNKGGMGDITFWGSNMASTYVLLKPRTDIVAFNNKISDFTISKIKSLYNNSKGLVDYEGTLFTRRFADAYLHNNFVNGRAAGGRIEYVRLFSVIALFILSIACINFMNLSTAKAAGRMKEAGMRKIMGAQRKMLVLQYLAESMLMSFLSLAIALVMASLLLPAFQEITGKTLSLHFSSGFILSIIAIGLVTGLLAGIYPALYLSGFKPAMVLKGKLQVSPRESFIRKGLVVFQFTISVVLIISVAVVYRQMKLVQTKNLGYDKEHVIVFSSEGKVHDNPDAFLDEVRQVPGVTSASTMEGDLLGKAGHSGGGINWDAKDPNLNIEYFGISGDYDYMELLGMKMASGRFFSRKYGADSLAVIFNESAIAAMGLKDPIGKIVSLWGKKKQVIGVVKDFHFESLYKKVGPSFLEYSVDNSNVLVKIKPGAENNTIAQIAKVYKTFNLGLPLEYRFMDDDYNAMYASEEKVQVLSRYFAGIAIIICCFGLFGLAAFTAQKRQKEIGIRKVVGASANNIVLLLSKDFLKLVFFAILIAFPIAWWALSGWLKNFAYRVDIGWQVFLIAGIAIVVITLLTVSYQAIRAAIADPVETLRSE